MSLKCNHGTPAKILTSRWVLRIKRDENGKILRYKARLLIHGFKQRAGLEYDRTYAPIVRIPTILLMLLIAMFSALEARHVDIETAFLNSWLVGVTIYMAQPRYFDDGTKRICLLKKGLYGLKQAARLWYQTLHARLVEQGFQRCAYDVGLYYQYVDQRIVLVTVYVDDMLIIGTPSDIDNIIAGLRERFVLKDLGRVSYLLGMEVHYRPGVILCLSQTAYIDRMLLQFQMDQAKTVRSPQMQNEKMLVKETDINKINDPNVPYRELVGELQYLVTCTRPDIANAVRSLGRHTDAYTTENYARAKRVLRYLKETRTFGLIYKREEAVPNNEWMVCAYSDADHANCPNTSRSVTGFVLQINGWSFRFKSKTQKSVTGDTCKSELLAASMCVEQFVWARRLINELKLNQLPGELRMDNQSTITICTSVGNYDGAIRYAKKSNKIAEMVECGEFTIKYVPTEDNIADMYTKALRPQRFEKLRDQLGVRNVQAVLAVTSKRRKREDISVSSGGV